MSFIRSSFKIFYNTQLHFSQKTSICMSLQITSVQQRAHSTFFDRMGKGVVVLKALTGRVCPGFFGSAPSALLKRNITELSANLTSKENCAKNCQYILKNKTLDELNSILPEFKTLVEQEKYLTQEEATFLVDSFKNAFFDHAKPLWSLTLAKSFPNDEKGMEEWAKQFLIGSDSFAKKMNLPLDSHFISCLIKETEEASGKDDQQKKLISNLVATEYFLQKCQIIDPKKRSECFSRRISAILSGSTPTKAEPGPFWGS